MTETDLTRAGALALGVATEPTNRKILRTMETRNVKSPVDGPVAITPGGRQAIFVGNVAERWLGEAPGRGRVLNSREGQAALSALIDAWSATVVHAVAAGPTTRGGLEQALGAPGPFDTPVEDLLERMRAADLLETKPGEHGDLLYSPTEWLRKGLAPLLVATRLELRDPPPEAVALKQLDVEAVFRLALPLLRLPEDASGTCALAVELGPGGSSGPVGVTVRVDAGRILGCEAGLDGAADARALASAENWLNTLIAPDTKSVHTSGDRLLAGLLLAELHGSFFGSGRRPLGG
jgi:hypothetical protein